MNSRLLTVLLASSIAVCAESVFQPQLGTKGDLVVAEDFSHRAAPDTKLWQSRQHTRWSIADGMLHGRPSTPDYQASRKDHRGLEPRLMIRTDLKDYAIEFRFRINSGEQHPVGAFFEIGHHFARVAFKESGLEMNIGDLKHQTVLTNEPNVQLETGKWYHVLAETRGDQTVVQFEDGPTLRAQDPRIAAHADGFGITGLRGGTMDVDDVKLWALEP